MPGATPGGVRATEASPTHPVPTRLHGEGQTRILGMQVDTGQGWEIQARCSGRQKLSPDRSKTRGRGGVGPGRMGRVWPCREGRLCRKRKCPWQRLRGSKLRAHSSLPILTSIRRSHILRPGEEREYLLELQIKGTGTCSQTEHPGSWRGRRAAMTASLQTCQWLVQLNKHLSSAKG